MTFSGVTLLFEEDNIIAVTGGDLAPSVNGEAIPMYQAVLVHAGDRLAFGMSIRKWMQSISCICRDLTFR